MNYFDRIDRAFEGAPTFPLTPSSKIVIMSDCHRGVGNSNDNFLKNETVFLSALQSYFKKGYTYVELGDGDELWENRSLDLIQSIHENVFRLLNCFQKEKRLYLIYGNHDFEKSAYSDSSFSYLEALLMKDCTTEKMLYLTHGHQVDVFNSTFWRLARFLVRYIWKPMEFFGVLDPTDAATNYRLSKKSEQRLNQWAVAHHSVLITGHTHRARSGDRKTPYFNSGCCIYPGGITALEIANRTIRLVKWFVGPCGDNRSLCVLREEISEPVSLDSIWESPAKE